MRLTGTTAPNMRVCACLLETLFSVLWTHLPRRGGLSFLVHILAYWSSIPKNTLYVVCQSWKDVFAWLQGVWVGGGSSKFPCSQPSLGRHLDNRPGSNSCHSFPGTIYYLLPPHAFFPSVLSFLFNANVCTFCKTEREGINIKQPHLIQQLPIFLVINLRFP